jgi:hypothetical protein
VGDALELAGVVRGAHQQPVPVDSEQDGRADRLAGAAEGDEVDEPGVGEGDAGEKREAPYSPTLCRP